MTSRATKARFWALGLASVFGVVLAALLLAALHPGTVFAIGVHSGFAALCHQLPERSFAIAGEPLAICHRCFGIYAGIVAGALAVVAGVVANARSALGWALAIVPMVVHVGLLQVVPAVDLVALRVATGVMLGAWLGAALPSALCTVDFTASDEHRSSRASSEGIGT